MAITPVSPSLFSLTRSVSSSVAGGLQRCPCLSDSCGVNRFYSPCWVWHLLPAGDTAAAQLSCLNHSSLSLSLERFHDGPRCSHEAKPPWTGLSEKDSRKNVHKDSRAQAAHICQRLSIVLRPRAPQSKSTGSGRKLQATLESRKAAKDLVE